MMNHEFDEIATEMLRKINDKHFSINKPFLIDILQKFFVDNGEKFIVDHIADWHSSIIKFRISIDKLSCLYNELHAHKIPLITCVQYFNDDFYLKSLINLKLNYYV
jgi:hypothetical protein